MEGKARGESQSVRLWMEAGTPSSVVCPQLS